MTEISEGDKMALLAEWVPIENAYRQALEKDHERERTGSDLPIHQTSAD